MRAQVGDILRMQEDAVYRGSVACTQLLRWRGPDAGTQKGRAGKADLVVEYDTLRDARIDESSGHSPRQLKVALPAERTWQGEAQTWLGSSARKRLQPSGRFCNRRRRRDLRVHERYVKSVLGGCLGEEDAGEATADDQELGAGHSKPRSRGAEFRNAVGGAKAASG